ncbi:hypothetical protein QBZ16_002707 [Prototheca wickerhamii]|uniref:RBR-type E3 ubiquitin transferase n=1 Tax=Prototheca wickerhamii TaxID=3111 RepID=A0AAD9IN38_PROWI|nr:hypothetical protein QBZ16_002707 [Prototheca wickerhamii]
MGDAGGWEVAVEELTVLASIYGEEGFGIAALSVPDGAGEATGPVINSLEQLAALDAPPGPRWTLSCWIVLEPDVPEAGVRVRGPSDESASGDNDAPAVAGLPPIALRAWLPESYPGASPASLSVEADWLSEEQAAALEAQLDENRAAAGLEGLPELWAQAEALRERALDCNPPPLRLSSDAALRLAEHACGVCLEAAPGSRCVRLGCGHVYCADCLRAQAAVGVSSGDLDSLRCPEPGCRAPYEAPVLRGLLDAEAFARWDALALERALAGMADAARCPRCAAVCVEDEDACARCARCLFVFCALCGEGWHPGRACVSAAARLEALRLRAAGGGAAARAALLRAEQDAASLAAIARARGAARAAARRTRGFAWRGPQPRRPAELGPRPHHRPPPRRRLRAGQRGVAGCPSCGQLLEREAGNNHARCWACGAGFCFLCRALLPRRGDAAAHFGPRGCRQHGD